MQPIWKLLIPQLTFKNIVVAILFVAVVVLSICFFVFYKNALVERETCKMGVDLQNEALKKQELDVKTYNKEHSKTEKQIEKKYSQAQKDKRIEKETKDAPPTDKELKKVENLIETFKKEEKK
ncbi:hypothetical protein [Helicobacter cetorum]|uniref:Uncharacterized protein n=1 Tax=Helicobacter cetorum (strain ATCC BAA-540 / CCUG 52418 / MIT 99-5656) TaxID=1163745 RepID=I0ERW0_HELCM|nr:hypothetical protein [Helicobacter cetorum]AFI05669.1 hypothetical protein HCD_03265 [Helicobacter cetorum MIT 99-5656]AFI05679.1 hypothetical protein HCD_03315 [Helicobacter cetorum MIT 99-5656]